MYVCMYLFEMWLRRFQITCFEHNFVIKMTFENLVKFHSVSYDLSNEMKCFIVKYVIGNLKCEKTVFEYDSKQNGYRVAQI